MVVEPYQKQVTEHQVPVEGLWRFFVPPTPELTDKVRTKWD